MEREEIVSLIDEHLDKCEDYQLPLILTFIEDIICDSEEGDSEEEEYDSEEEYEIVEQEELSPEEYQRVLDQLKNQKLPPILKD